MFRVQDITRDVREVLESYFGALRIEGEISNLRKPSSGHWYFTLKDDAAQLRCAMFRGRNRLLRFDLEDGQQVIINTRLSLYEARGDFQAIVEHIEPAGDGALRLAFEQLRARLDKQGLFSAQRKRALPTNPAHVAVITSATGAALKDILAVLRQRYPLLKVSLFPALVQGEHAAADIARALQLVSTQAQALSIDLVICGRGGGSLEDLWPFNEEIVAHAIANCSVPVISAVGHEIDTSIADLVADQRAPTPSAAAEMCSPDIAEIRGHLTNLQTRLAQRQSHCLRQAQQRLSGLQRRVREPSALLRNRSQRQDELELRMQRAHRRVLGNAGKRLQSLRSLLQALAPQQQLKANQGRLNAVRARLIRIEEQLQQRRKTLAALARALQAVSPLNTLERGYAIAALPDGSDGLGVPVRDASDVSRGDQLLLYVQKGVIECEVIDTQATIPASLHTADPGQRNSSK